MEEQAILRRLYSKTLLLLEVVDLRSRILAFRGAGGEPPAALRH
jgi:hypothetical protein